MRSTRAVSLLMLAAGLCGAGAAQEAEKAGTLQAPAELLVPEGTSIPIILTTYLNTRSSQVGDNFYAETTYPIWIQQRQVIPRGSIVKGTVTQVHRPGRIKGKGRIAVKFDSVLLPNGVLRQLIADLNGIHGPGAEKIDHQTETVEMDSSKGRDVGGVAAGAGQGAIIGAIAGGGKGAAIGAGAGSAVGLATVLLTRGRELVISPGTQFDLVLKHPLRFAYGELVFSDRELESAQRSMTQMRSRQAYDDDRPVQRSPIPWGFPWP